MSTRQVVTMVVLCLPILLGELVLVIHRYRFETRKGK